MNITQKILKTISRISSVETAHAHCDLPCGIYDPHQAIIGALTVVRMMDIIKEHAEHLQNEEQKYMSDLGLHNNLARAIAIKEDHAELVKKEVRTIWGDYFKPEMRAENPQLDGLVHEIMQLGSKSKQTVERDTAMQLLNKVNEFAEIFWKSKGKETKRVKAPYKPEEEIVVPVL
jgi:nickel superoxide dismutase